MSEIFLANEVLVFLLGETVLFVLLCIAAAGSLKIWFKWDFNAFTPAQFALEKRSYLVATIITFAFVLKFVLLPYFAYSLDRLALLIPGAMCAAGVIGANGYGYGLLVFKIAVLFMTGAWLGINRYDLGAVNYPAMRLKSLLFLALFLLLGIELLLDYAFFANLTTEQPVSCCSVIFGLQGGGNTLPFGLDTTKLLVLFALFYLMGVIGSLDRNVYVTALGNLLFLPTAYYAVVYFFGIYIYQLPTHQCPFCMLQAEYGYVGYLVWAALFCGTFFGINALVMRLVTGKRPRRAGFLFSLAFNTLFVSLCSAYVLVYYLRNGVWL